MKSIECPFCGEQIEITACPEDIAAKRKSPLKIKIIKITCILLVIAMAIIITLMLVRVSSPERVVDVTIKTFNSGKASEITKVLPEEYVKATANDSSIMRDLISGLSSTKDYYKNQYGSGSFSHKILNKKKLSADEVNEYEERLGNYLLYDMQLSSVNVSEGYEMSVLIEYKGDKGYNAYVNTMYIYKIDGRWCADIFVL